ncbi:MAG: dihydrolipoamide acetyltransferase family protein [Betaproteobacteria bacterium]
MADFTMPALGADMETGRVVHWNVRPGDRVRPGDVVAVVETHKGAIDVECFLEGEIGELAPLGEDLPVGAVLARVRTAGEGADAVADPAHSPAPAAAPASAPALAHAPAGVPAHAPEPTLAAAPAPEAAPRGEAAARARVTPVARRRAGELGLDADALAGTGPDGAVTLADVECAAALGVKRPAGERAEVAASPRAARGGFDPAQMRQAIAAAMGRSKREIPHYYLSTTVDFARAQAWLDAYNAERDPVDRLLPAALLLKASALALVQVPQLNGLYENGVFRAGAGVHVGWAIALRGGGLVAPAVHDADRLPLPALMAALRDLVQRARAGGLRSSELTDPTVTVTSLGERGAESVYGVIYPPQVAIVGFGRVVERPAVVDGQVVARPQVTVTLAADHRASDGHLGGQLLAAIDRALQSPATL